MPLSDSGSRHHGYSRKQKSLGLLCTNFLALYNRDGIESIGLDDAANKLGVERRRIYDIVNVLESIRVLEKKAKNLYTWKGFKAIPKALAELKEQGLKKELADAEGTPIINMAIGDEEELFFNSGSQHSNPTTCSQQSNPNCGSQPEVVANLSNQVSASSKKEFCAVVTDNRREKSLALLTQNFVKLFLCTDTDIISLDEAARQLLGGGHHSATMRTKVRRLYDIANVLSSLCLIEKTHESDSKKPAFRWLGFSEAVKSEATRAQLAVAENHKRAFGTDITNSTNSERKRVPDYSTQQDLTKCPKIQMKAAEVPKLVLNAGGDTQQQHRKLSSKSINFGPFAPEATRVSHLEPKCSVYHLPDLETLSSKLRLQYHNHALKELFDHYIAAWKTWMAEVTRQ